MAHFAELDNVSMVKRVLVVNNEVLLKDGVENEQQGIDFLVSLFGGWWRQTSYNGSFRKNYAGEGMFYDKIVDAFIPPKPPFFSSWVFDEDICRWQAPIIKPDDGKAYTWDEANTEWKEME